MQKVPLRKGTQKTDNEPRITVFPQQERCYAADYEEENKMMSMTERLTNRNIFISHEAEKKKMEIEAIWRVIVIVNENRRHKRHDASSNSNLQIKAFVGRRTLKAAIAKDISVSGMQLESQRHFKAKAGDTLGIILTVKIDPKCTVEFNLEAQIKNLREANGAYIAHLQFDKPYPVLETALIEARCPEGKRE
jgi:hypothetical protein